MQSLLIISRLLDYPDEELWQARDEIELALVQCTELTAQDRSDLLQFLDAFYAVDLAENQSRYVAQFDHSRRSALYLCEHQLSESKQRGQAMVNILQQYRRFALTPVQHELPDYLPMILEFAYLRSVDDPPAAYQILLQISAVLRTLQQRLQGSHYGVLFSLLLRLSGTAEEVQSEVSACVSHGSDLDVKQNAQQMDMAEPDMDAEWEKAHRPVSLELTPSPQAFPALVHYLNLGQ
ncbi:MAG: nitrate reductase molybdenum cofactor assembly chaperone [Plesiomonas shigelloides]